MINSDKERLLDRAEVMEAILEAEINSLNNQITGGLIRHHSIKM